MNYMAHFAGSTRPARSRSRRALALLLTLVGSFFFFPFIVFGATFQSASSIELKNPINDDAYLVGRSVRVDQNISGDLFAFGKEIVIRGDIDGDVLALGGHTQIDGNVSGDVRVLSGSVDVRGHIGEDLVTGSGNVSVASNATIGNDMLVSGGTVEFDGTVHGNLKGDAQLFALRGWVDKNAELSAKKFTVAPNMHITGNFSYHALMKLDLPPDSVAGEISFTPFERSLTFQGKVGQILSQVIIVKKTISYLGFLVIGLVLMLFIPGEFTAISRGLHFEFLRYLGRGFLLTVAWAVASLVAITTIIGLPLGFIGLLVLLVWLYVQKAFAGFWLGSLLISPERRSRVALYGIYALGLFLLFLIGFIPVIGWVFELLLVLASFGAFLERRKDMFDILKQKRFFALPTK